MKQVEIGELYRLTAGIGAGTANVFALITDRYIGPTTGKITNFIVRFEMYGEIVKNPCVDYEAEFLDRYTLIQ